jgi:hypothetical protein
LSLQELSGVKAVSNGSTVDLQLGILAVSLKGFGSKMN